MVIRTIASARFGVRSSSSSRLSSSDGMETEAGLMEGSRIVVRQGGIMV